MRRHNSISQLTAFSVLACFLILGNACAPPQRTSDAPAQPARSVASDNPTQAGPAQLRDLSQDEAAGGHTLRKHVGRTDGELGERLRHERHIAAASTWTNRPTAEQAVGTALAENAEKIQQRLNRQAGHPNLVIDYDGIVPLVEPYNAAQTKPNLAITRSSF